MGFCQNIVMSSAVEDSRRREMWEAARGVWPFVRGPARPHDYRRHLILAPPELTDYLYQDEAAYELAVEQSGQIEDGLPPFSQRFPEVTFAYVSADCFGGTCLYSGYCCVNGEIIAKMDQASRDGHIELLREVGIETTGYFAPFTRGFFDA